MAIAADVEIQFGKGVPTAIFLHIMKFERRFCNYARRHGGHQIQVVHIPTGDCHLQVLGDALSSSVHKFLLVLEGNRCRVRIDRSDLSTA